MIRYYGGVREVAREISSAADGALNAYRDGRVTEEPQITDRIIGAIEDRIGRKRPDEEAAQNDKGEISHWTPPVHQIDSSKEIMTMRRTLFSSASIGQLVA